MWYNTKMKRIDLIKPKAKIKKPDETVAKKAIKETRSPIIDLIKPDMRKKPEGGQVEDGAVSKLNIRKRSLACIDAIAEGVMKTHEYPAKGIMRTGPSELSQFYTESCDNSHKYEVPISRDQLKKANERLEVFFETHERLRRDHQVHLKKTDRKPRLPGTELRKVYISPRADQVPEFLEALMRTTKKHEARWIDAKTNPGDALSMDDVGRVVGQDHNLVCFYFRDDQQFNRFIQSVKEAERVSGVSLLHFEAEKMPMHGQALGGAIQFGVDLAGDGQGGNFDGWSTKLVAAGIEAKNRGAEKDDIKKAIEAKLRETRGVEAENYLALRQEI